MVGCPSWVHSAVHRSLESQQWGMRGSECASALDGAGVPSEGCEVGLEPSGSDSALPSCRGLALSPSRTAQGTVWTHLLRRIVCGHYRGSGAPCDPRRPHGHREPLRSSSGSRGLGTSSAQEVSPRPLHPSQGCDPTGDVLGPVLELLCSPDDISHLSVHLPSKSPSVWYELRSGQRS